MCVVYRLPYADSHRVGIAYTTRMNSEGDELHNAMPSWPKVVINGTTTFVEKKGGEHHRAFVQVSPGKREWFHVKAQGATFVPSYSERYAYVGDVGADGSFDVQRRRDDGSVEPEFSKATLVSEESSS